MRLFLSTALLLLYSCSQLKTVHTDNVKSYARSAKLIAAVPGKLYEGIADFRYDLKMVEASTVHRPDKLVIELNKIAELNKRYHMNAFQVRTATLLIESYAECLLALTDAAYEKGWSKQSDELSLQLTSAFASYNKTFNQRIPATVGGFIGGVVTKMGSLKLRSLQKKYLRSFIDTGAVIINNVCDYYTSDVTSHLETELASLDNQFTNVFTHFYDEVYEYQKQQSINSFDYLKQYNPLYLEMKQRLDDLHTLQAKIVAVMTEIKAAHQSLQTLVNQKSGPGLIVAMQGLYTTSNDIRLLLKKVEKK